MADGYHFEIRGMPEKYNSSNRLRGGVSEWLRQLLGADTHLEESETRMYKRSVCLPTPSLLLKVDLLTIHTVRN